MRWKTPTTVCSLRWSAGIKTYITTNPFTRNTGLHRSGGSIFDDLSDLPRFYKLIGLRV